MDRPVKIVLAKLGLDDHTRPLYVLARAFRDAGMEVLYLGPYQTAESVVETAIQEDADAIALSFHNLAHMGWLREVTQLLRDQEAVHIQVFAGGIIPREDRPALEAMGVKGIFGPGTPMSTIIDYIQAEVASARRQEARRHG